MRQAGSFFAEKPYSRPPSHFYRKRTAQRAAKVAAELGTDVATVALSWVHNRPGVSSTILGARTMEHLEANLKALDVCLSPEQTAALDAASKPKLNFSYDLNMNLSPNFEHAGATVNGVPSKLVGHVPKDDASRY